ncbi:MAG TPA: hypothetical protein VNI83_11765 [Vicinamibacterales bacterium]|nr:hypothetical protein [Vicinamibacterales bacterium]
MTGDTANPVAWRFLQEARAPVLAKPFSPDALLRAVERVAGAARLRRAGAAAGRLTLARGSR